MQQLPASGVGPRAIGYRLSAKRKAAVNTRKEAASCQLPAASFQLPASSIQLPGSSFQHPASSLAIGYRLKEKQLSALSIQHSAEATPTPTPQSGGNKI
jgi:hypothetical protein